MRSLVLLALLCVLSPALPVTSAEADTGDPHKLNQRLKAEYPLARTQKIYVVFDLEARRIALRASGLTVAEFPIARYRLWGASRPTASSTLLDKKSLFGPQRQVIDLSEAAEKKSTGGELRALELDDMPDAYQLVLSDGVRISVDPEPGGLFGRTLQLVDDGFWSLSRPLISDWNFILGRPYTELALTLSETDARRLHWSFSEGAACLILWPRE